MNRSHSVDSYLAILERVRAARPDIAVSGDFIVGFPGESDSEFEETLKLVEAVNYAQAYSFKYSARPGTPAAEMDEQVPGELMDERLQRLQALLNAQQQEFNRAAVGRRTTILLERPGRKPGQLVGKTPWLQSVHLETEAAIGDLIEVGILSAGPNSLAGAELMRVAA
jgi:tRNA-2-methylthio-N6-dimethylallyladenosine synthase